MNTDILAKSVQYIKESLPPTTPVISLTLGSGWSEAVADLDLVQTIPYSKIPALGETSVKGHSGELKIADIDTHSVLIFQGRRHWYEGAGWEPVIFPAFLSAELGIKSMLLTNAAGGINPDFKPGDLMLIDDHINMMGNTPLMGCPTHLSKTTFPDQSNVYNKELKKVLKESAAAVNLPLQHGVYLAASGPTYETPAEIRAFRTMGADAVGMSTVPEAIIANALGIKTAGLSCITNMASGVSEVPLCHEEVIAAASIALPGITALLLNFLKKI